jgi:4'-phosphopantetheinyl transferase EntD
MLLMSPGRIFLASGERRPQTPSRIRTGAGCRAPCNPIIGAGHTNLSPVLRRTGREPAWPSGIVGSITNCGSWAIAAVAKAESLKSLGIDLEDVEAVPHEEIAELVCSDVEREWVFRGGNSKLKLAMLFSAKEAVDSSLPKLGPVVASIFY